MYEIYIYIYIHVRNMYIKYIIVKSDVEILHLRRKNGLRY